MNLYVSRGLIVICVPILLLLALVAGLLVGPVLAIACLHEDLKRHWMNL